MRRRSLLAFPALATLPGTARAQTPLPEIAPAPSPAVAPPPPSQPAALPPSPPTIARPLPATAIDKTKTYYVFFEATLDGNTTRRLRQQLATLVDAGVSEITIVMSSPGGQLDATIQTYGFIRALPARIRTHAQSFVMSAATVLFLAGEERTADRASRFLFHPAQTTSPLGPVGEQQVRERLSAFQAVESVVAQVYRDRTRLTDADIQRFERETVIMTAEQAQAVQIVDSVMDLRIPEGRSKIVLLD